MIELSLISALSAFTAVIISFLSPCVLPLVPGYVSYIGGYSLGRQEQGLDDRSLRETLAVLCLSLNFVLGFSTVFIAFGASATAIGQWIAYYSFEANIVGGAIIIVFGVFLSGL